MEYAEGGELFNYIIQKGYLSEDESREIFQQLIDGIYYLHQMGICHRDLKPENILFDTKDKKRIKIIDFGLSNLYIYSNSNKNKNLLETPCGSPGYAPPEMVFGIKYDGIMTDIWSCGIILYAMMMGCLPFDDKDEEKLYKKIIEGKYEYPDDVVITEEAKNFIDSLLVIDPKYRANINDIKKNKWFLKNYKPSFGLFISICEIPVSNEIIKEMLKMGYKKNKIIENIKNNDHNNLTTIYYLLVKQKIKKGIEIESDLISNHFKEYIKKQNNYIIKNNLRPLSLKEIIEQKEEKKEEKKEENINLIKLNTYREKKRIESNINQNINESNKENKKIKINIKKKNKTVSKEKSKHKKKDNFGINNININNIKNIHYININNIKTNFLIKSLKTEKNNNKKIEHFSKCSKEKSNSKSKSKKNNSQNKEKLNFSKTKERKELYTDYYNNKKFLSKPIKIHVGLKNNIKNNKTIVNNLKKDFNISMNNNFNNINSDLTLQSYNNLKFSDNIRNELRNENIRKKLLLSNILTYGNFNSKSNLTNQTKKEKTKKFKEKEKHFPCILKKKIRNINIDHISQLLNNIKTSRKRENNFMKIFDTNPKSSSNSRTQSKSNTSRVKSWKKDFLIFNSSRNYNKKCSLKKIWKKQIFNLTHEKSPGKKNMKNNNKASKDKQKKSNLNIKHEKSNQDSSNFNIIFSNKNSRYSNIINNNKKNNQKITKTQQINNLNINNFQKNKKNQRNNIFDAEHKKIKSSSNMNISIKNDKSFNFSNILKYKEKNKKNELILNKNTRDKISKKNPNMNNNKKGINYKLNIKNKLKDYSKYNNIENISNINSTNTIDTFSKDISDISYLRMPNKAKINKTRENKSNKIDNKNKKKIKLGKIEINFKNIFLFQNRRKNFTFKKNQKFLDENAFK